MLEGGSLGTFVQEKYLQRSLDRRLTLFLSLFTVLEIRHHFLPNHTVPWIW